ncbi:MAG: 4-hydroxybutyrate CoA-transferase [Chloroflexi bacterium]|nr:4-hydroxybutyrate CoA-transferase [Chloroflexota bacterium]
MATEPARRRAARAVLGMREPPTVVAALVAAREQLRGLRLLVCSVVSRAPYAAPEATAALQVTALFVGPALRRAVRERRVAYLPCHFSALPRLVRRGDLPATAVLLHLSPPDADGWCSTGLAADHTLAALDAARPVIGEVSPAVPYVYGGNRVHLGALDLVVEGHAAPEVFARAMPGKVERAIGDRVAALIRDGATIETGFGAVSEAALAALRGHRDLGLHSGLLGDGAMDLIERGVITGRRKSIDRDLAVSCAIRGSAALYRWVDRHPAVRLEPFDYTHSLDTLARLEHFVAVNSALQVDLTGQVNAEGLGWVTLSGAGGQVDWVRGALAAPGGRSIIALPSLAGGEHSTIVPCFAPGTPVTTTRAEAHYVVTEHGVADLRAKTLPERAAALIAIADPSVREDLSRAAAEL